MSSSLYYYFVPYEKDPNIALEKLKEREFRAGRYNPATMFPDFPVTEESASPGAQHDSIDDAREASMESGTRSILDMDSAGSEDEFCVARVLSPDELIDSFGTRQPTHLDALEGMENFGDLERGKGICVTVFDEKGRPAEYLFVGFSFD